MKLKEYFLPNFIGNIGERAKFIIIFLQIILVISLTQLNTNELVPKPSGIIESLSNVVSKKDFADDFISTLFLVFKGMGISIFISLIICYISLIPIFKGISQLVSKMRFLTYTGLVVVFTFILKDSSSIKTSLLLFGIVPYFVTSMVSYIGDISQKEYQLCYTLKMTRWEVLYEVIVRGKLHLALETIRQNFGICWVMIVSAEEIFMSEGGLGTLMKKSSKYLHINDVFAVLFIIFVTGILFDYFFDLLKVYLFPYTDTKRYRNLWINKYIFNTQEKTQENGTV
jgi:ABC-type nitrate/sulfonate/bicarbonate transport system permease component